MPSSVFTTRSILAKSTDAVRICLCAYGKKEIKRPTLIFKSNNNQWRIPKIAMTFYFIFENVSFITSAISISDRVRPSHPPKNDPQPACYILCFKTHIMILAFFTESHNCGPFTFYPSIVIL